MIQDIAPHIFDNAFVKKNAENDSTVIAFCNDKVLVYMENGTMVFPLAEHIRTLSKDSCNQMIYAFSIDGKPFFLMVGEINERRLPYGMNLIDIRRICGENEKWMRLAAVTARHLNHWYSEHRYCGCCGNRMGFSGKERAMICTECGNIQYPRISPVIMAAVTDGDRLLVTRYSGRSYKGLALIAGFVEIGESIEGALRREVMEEVGLKVKNLKYFGSQPWGFSDSVITGFFAELDGSDQVELDRDELSEAIWLSRDEIPVQDTGLSITAAMIEAFRKGEV